jgi:hypothetical protein
VLREKCGKYGDRTVDICNRLCLENSLVNMGIGLYSCAIECASGNV